MRLGAWPCRIERDSKAFEAYKTEDIRERHRHRYEFNNNYRDLFEEHGMRFCGTSPDGELVEMVELRDHPWFVAVQFHPEFRSMPVNPHPLFTAFVAAALKRRLGTAYPVTGIQDPVTTFPGASPQ